MNFASALECGQEGLAIARQSDTFEPTALIFIPGRQITTSFGETMRHIGETEMLIFDHFDALTYVDGIWYCRVGYTFTQADILAEDWFTVNRAADLIATP